MWLMQLVVHHIQRIRLSDVPLQRCGQQHPFWAVLPPGGDIVVGVLDVVTEKMTCFSVWSVQNHENIPKTVIVTEIHSAFSVSIAFPLHCKFAPAFLSKLRSYAQGQLCLLSATTVKINI